MHHLILNKMLCTPNQNVHIDDVDGWQSWKTGLIFSHSQKLEERLAHIVVKYIRRSFNISVSLLQMGGDYKWNIIG